MASRLSLNRGTSFSISYEHQHDGEAHTLVDATLFFTVKTAEYDSDTTDASALISKTVTSHTDAASGLSTITIDPSDTDDITPGRYFYDLKVKEADGSIFKVDEGRFDLDGSPTNRMS